MIRKLEPADTEAIIEIWYSASVLAHSFIPPEIWQGYKDELRNKYLPTAETWVAEEGGELLGFISLLGDYIGALFVAPARQGRGIGSRLLAKAKQERLALTVGVYGKNAGARRFYQRQGFTRQNEEIQQETGEIVINMAWSHKENG